MGKKQISVILTALLLPLLLMGQKETYTINASEFSTDKYDEFSPVYFENGIVFCSNRSGSLLVNYSNPENKGLLKIYFADFANPGKARLFSKTITSRFNDGPASFNRRGDTIYFSRNLKVDGPLAENSNPRNKLGIFTASVSNGKWDKITGLRFNNEYYNITTPYISPDGKRLFFASDNPEGLGGTDLYYCNWKADYWDEPINMGPEINTSGNESYPFVNREGGLYFSSDGRSGLGGKDIYYTKLSGNKWLPPVRLDPPINSEYDDFGLIADSVMNEGYFSSKRNNTVDIYHFKTRFHQIFYPEPQQENQYCFRFSDDGKIPVDERYIKLSWTFGDGGTATGLTAEHCFKGPGRYNVKLDAVDKKTGKVFFPVLAYTVELRDIEQPIINSPASGTAGGPIAFDGLASNFPGYDILSYTWDFGDGNRDTGEKVNHAFMNKGDYDVKLGLMIRNNGTGIIRQAASSRKISIFSDRNEKAAFDNRPVRSAGINEIFDSVQAKISDLYSSGRDYNQDQVFQVELLTSKTKLVPDDPAFKNLPKKYSVRELYRGEDKLYSYIIDEEMSLMATYWCFNEITGLGFSKAKIRTFTIEDAATKELNNIKKVFPLSADSFFRKNDFTLTSEGTQILDLIIGFMAKYPSIKLEIANHTDNLGQAASNQLLTQRRSEAMVNYLVSNGVSALRLIPKGFGGTRPVSSNYLDADRKFNRRTDFNIVGK
ncbi:MAG: PKD domain-containing protein [Bacteroidales bacterium]